MRRFPLLLFLFASSVAHALKIDVAPDGKISSLAAARDAVRQARAAGEKGAITVRIAAGEYPLTEAVIFEPKDSGVTYEAVAGANPVFVGTKKVTGWKAGKDGVWTAAVEPGSAYEALWVNGRRAIRARTPNDDYLYPLAVPSKPLPGLKAPANLSNSMLQVAPGDAALLKDVSPAEMSDVNAVVLHSWNETRHRVAGVDAASGTLQFTGGTRAFFSLEPFHRIYFENYRGALDAPGEWFLAKDGTLFYIPRDGENPETAVGELPLALQWIVIRGDAAKDETLVRDLHFRGLSFRGQSWTLPPEGVGFSQAVAPLGAAIEADGVRDLTIDGCRFEQTITNVLWLRRGCRDVVVKDTLFRDMGAGAVKIGTPEYNPKELASDPQHTSHVTVENCILQTGGRYFPSAVGLIIFHASDCTIRHCDIGDFFYSPISIGWTWGYKPTPCARNVVELCHLHHYGYAVLSDMAAVYTLGPQPGTVIRNCHIHDAGCASYGAWGMYNDEGSTGIVWENNLVHDTQSAGYHQHYGRGNIVRNNIIARGAEEHVRWSRPEEFLGFAFERNIVLVGDGRLFMHVDKNWDNGRVFLADNVYWKPGGTIAEFAGKTWADWQFMGRDTNSVVADPLFVDAAHGDWTLRPESPALKVGFVPLDWKKAGVTGSNEWKQLAATQFPPMKYGMKPKAPPLKLNEGFENSPVGAKPSIARMSKNVGKTIVVTGDQASAGARSLLLTDGPDLGQAFEPHFYFNTNVQSGVTRVSFDVRMEPEYKLTHEWRDSSTPYRTGPKLDFENGAVRANGKKLADFPANTWVHVEVSAKIDGDATWSAIITPRGGPPQRFDGLKYDKSTMAELKWIGWASNGKAVAKCWLDEIAIENDLP
ncbi:MAG: right-handed parallel beta-helix repeat-containing protein [Chthoniobacteraceae bacterium]